jgi:uncharacterized tellurite resistance protein B-like protein
MEKYRSLESFNARYFQYLKSAASLRDYYRGQEHRLIEVMNDLISIASSDASLQEEELSLIRAAVKTWWLDLDPAGNAGADVLKTDLPPDRARSQVAAGEESWGRRHDLMYLFVCLGHLPDREFTFEEVETIMRLWRRRFPTMKLDEFQKIRSAVMKRYNCYQTHQDRYNQFLVSAWDLQTSYKTRIHRLAGILEDLFTIAQSDHSIHENEIALIEAAAKLWHLNIELAVNKHLKRVQMTVTPSEVS